VLFTPDIDTVSTQEFAALLEESFKSEPRPGEVVVGEILKVQKDGLLVDMGGKSEGFVPLKEIPGQTDSLGQYQEGQVKEFFFVRALEDEDIILLSVRRVAAYKTWDQLKALKDEGKTLDAIVTGITKGGVIVQVLELKGFVPASQLRVAKPLPEVVGDTIPVKILEVDKHKNKLILSHRSAIFEQKAALRAETISRLQSGDIVEGEIVKVTDFGVFIDIQGIDGLLPLSEITWQRINHPSQILALGQRLTVKVLTVDQALQRISLSLKRMQEDPWDKVPTTFRNGDVVTGRISKQLASGVLVELMPGVEAFSPYENGGKQYRFDEICQFEIVSIYTSDRRITLKYMADVSNNDD
jgi:small subunit ribosomal protein S1